MIKTPLLLKYANLTACFANTSLINSTESIYSKEFNFLWIYIDSYKIILNDYSLCIREKWVALQITIKRYRSMCGRGVMWLKRRGRILNDIVIHKPHIFHFSGHCCKLGPNSPLFYSCILKRNIFFFVDISFRGYGLLS